MNFLKIMLASMVGTLLTIALISLISIAIVAGIIAAASAPVETVAPKTVLHLKLNKPIMEREPRMPFFINLAGPSRSLGLSEILSSIRQAKKDKNIKGIYLDLTDIPSGISTISEVRTALADFKTSGKFIYAYSEYMSQGAYYLASVADKIYLHPQGGILFKGINSELMFLKGTLEKLDVKMQIIRHGKFKAATEPLFLDKMSPENRKQITELITSVWNDMLLNISESRGISKADLNLLADSLNMEDAAQAVSHRLADSLLYYDQFLSLLKGKLGLTEDQKVKSITLEKYEDVPESGTSGLKSDKIAVIYAQGNVVDGEGDEQSIGGDRFALAIRKAREDTKVKAIVLRVNSPGGSALASDVVLREVLLANEAKPVVASFGDVAASGGYYIACGARRIFSDPTTITGSIGVWAAIPNFKGLLNSKLGITFDAAKTNANSDFISVTQPLSPYQSFMIQKEIDHIYEVFVAHVSKGRNMPAARVDSIGQGRIWSGTDARQIGLVDELGGIEKAIKSAADLAGIKDYRVVDLPEQKEPLQVLMDEFFGSSVKAAIARELGSDYKYYEYLKQVRELKGIQARMPFDITLN
jgi:protease IV